jgi:hypothetical protein
MDVASDFFFLALCSRSFGRNYQRKFSTGMAAYSCVQFLAFSHILWKQDITTEGITAIGSGYTEQWILMQERKILAFVVCNHELMGAYCLATSGLILFLKH